MSDGKWSEWIEWNGGECPLTNGTTYRVKFRAGLPASVEDQPEELDWSHGNGGGDIIAYRYKIKEPESDMHPDLKWLAENVSEWPTLGGTAEPKLIYRFFGVDGESCLGRNHPTDTIDGTEYTKAQWLQARQQLGLDQPEPTEAEEEAWQAKERELNHQRYSPYFKDVSKLDRIDVYRVVSLFDCEKHGHAISHAVKKLLLTGVRTGGKDVETEVREAIDSLNRWLEMREEDNQ